MAEEKWEMPFITRNTQYLNTQYPIRNNFGWRSFLAVLRSLCARQILSRSCDCFGEYLFDLQSFLDQRVNPFRCDSFGIAGQAEPIICFSRLFIRDVHFVGEIAFRRSGHSFFDVGPNACAGSHHLPGHHLAGRISWHRPHQFDNPQGELVGSVFYLFHRHLLSQCRIEYWVLCI